jgi:hypothetical protein
MKKTVGTFTVASVITALMIKFFCQLALAGEPPPAWRGVTPAGQVQSLP